MLQLGYSLPRYGADGDFGGETAAAIKRFQARAGLAQDGVYGGDTHKALMDAVARFTTRERSRQTRRAT